MPESPDPEDVIRARIAVLTEERARLEQEIERHVRALEALTGTYCRANSDNMSNTPIHPLVQAQYSKSSEVGTRVGNFLKVCYAAGIPSLHELAKVIRDTFGTKTKQAHISFGLQGARPIDDWLTEWIAKQTVSEEYPHGFESTKAHWPKLRTGRKAPQPKKNPSH